MTTSYTNGGNSASRFYNSSKKNPCPVCGRIKDGDCRISRDGRLVLCHQNFNHTKTQQPDLWHFNGETSDGRCGEYVFKEPTTKSIRPKQTRYWEYPARDGSRLVRVVRSDDGEGNKKISQERWDKDKQRWLPGWGKDEDVNKVARASIPIYRRAEVREAIAKGEPIHIVEGEPCADLLWKLGLAATTNIGGGGKFTVTDSMDLQGAEIIVIVPDRDKKGIEHAEKVAEYFPQALWLYPFPLSKVWENLPEDHGLDIADWIEHEKLSAAELRDASGEKKVFNAPAPAPTPTPQAAANVIRPPQFQIPPISELEGEIEELLDSDLKKSQLQLKISELALKFRVSSADIWKIYREREQELEQEANQEDTRIGIEQLLASQAANVKLSEIFPESLAAPIEEIARRMNLKPECYALALISGISRFLKNGSSTMLVDEWNYWCRTHGYFGAMIAESSQMKTPVLNAMISDPLAAMRKANQEKFKAQEKAYKEELEQWKNSKDEDKGPPPDAPVEKLPYITKATWEGVAAMVSSAPTQGILWLCDELAGFFKSANQYRSGRGSDQEDLLECWSGNGAVVVRATGTTVNVGAVSLSIYGNIQPKVLAPFLGDGSDDNGTFARFDFVQQPRALTQITLGLSRIDINPMLQALYERVDAIPLMQFELDQEAKELFVDYYNHCQRLRFDHPKQGMRAMLGKAAEKVGRVATILHCIHNAHFGAEVSQKIPASRVRAAIKWVEYTTQQALSINIEVCSPDALESNLAKIISLAERNGGKVTARDVLRIFDSKYRPTSQTVREWFADLEAMKYGEVTEKGRSICFSLRKTSAFTAFAGNPDDASVLNAEDKRGASAFTAFSTQKYEITEINAEETRRKRGGNAEDDRVLKSSVGKDLNSNAVNAEDFTSSAETTQSSMLSCTTNPAEFAEQIRKAIANFDRVLAVEVTKALKDKTKLRREVRAALTVEEFENFRLLVTAGFVKGTRVKYVGDPKYAEQYEGLELEVYSMDKYSLITCRKPDGYLTTRMKPEELEKL
jgi:CRISPR-associated protein Cmr3